MSLQYTQVGELANNERQQRDGEMTEGWVLWHLLFHKNTSIHICSALRHHIPLTIIACLIHNIFVTRGKTIPLRLPPARVA